MNYLCLKKQYSFYVVEIYSVSKILVKRFIRNMARVGGNARNLLACGFESV